MSREFGSFTLKEISSSCARMKRNAFPCGRILIADSPHGWSSYVSGYAIAISRSFDSSDFSVSFPITQSSPRREGVGFRDALPAHGVDAFRARWGGGGPAAARRRAASAPHTKRLDRRSIGWSHAESRARQ